MTIEPRSDIARNREDESHWFRRIILVGLALLQAGRTIHPVRNIIQRGVIFKYQRRDTYPVSRRAKTGSIESMGVRAIGWAAEESPSFAIDGLRASPILSDFCANVHSLSLKPDGVFTPSAILFNAG